jgi:hypothetical protein
MGNDFETLLTTLPTVDVSPDFVICDDSTLSLLTYLPSIDVAPDASRALALALGLGRACADIYAATVNLRTR